jgi:hypothetical protein
MLFPRDRFFEVLVFRIGGFSDLVSQRPGFQETFPKNRFFKSRFLKSDFQIAVPCRDFFCGGFQALVVQRQVCGLGPVLPAGFFRVDFGPCL